MRRLEQQHPMFPRMPTFARSKKEVGYATQRDSNRPTLHYRKTKSMYSSNFVRINRWDLEERIVSRIAREVNDDDDDESARQVTISESQLLKTNSRFLLHAQESPGKYIYI